MNAQPTNDPHANEDLDMTRPLTREEAPGVDETVLREEPHVEDPYAQGPDPALAAAAAGDPREEDSDSGFHPVNVTHLVMGIAFLAFAGIWAVLARGTVEGEDLRWLLPIPWLLAGTAGLVASVAGRRSRLERRRQRNVQPGA